MGCEISIDLCFGTLLKGTRLGHGHELRYNMDADIDRGMGNRHEYRHGHRFRHRHGHEHVHGHRHRQQAWTLEVGVLLIVLLISNLLISRQQKISRLTEC